MASSRGWLGSGHGWVLNFTLVFLFSLHPPTLPLTIYDVQKNLDPLLRVHYKKCMCHTDDIRYFGPFFTIFFQIRLVLFRFFPNFSISMMN